jgi:hypothetical protein
VGDVRRDGYHGLPHRLRHHGLGWKIRLGPWIYRTAGGAYAYEAVRFDWQPDDHRPPPKGFEDGKTYSPLVRTSDGSHFGRWSQPEPRILYRLPELRAGIEQGRRVWIVEGEKSAEALVALGEVATCNPGGALSWPAVDFHALAGAREVLAAVDRDERGARWAADVVATLAKLEIRPRLLQSATTEKGDDVADHLEAGFGLGDLKEFTA